MRRLIRTFCILALAALSACAAGPRYQSGYFAEDPTQPYTLASGDRLRVIVFGQDSLSNSYSVDGSGHISMPLIGLVPAQGAAAAVAGEVWAVDARCLARLDELVLQTLDEIEKLGLVELGGLLEHLANLVLVEPLRGLVSFVRDGHDVFPF